MDDGVLHNRLQEKAGDRIAQHLLRNIYVILDPAIAQLLDIQIVDEQFDFIVQGGCIPLHPGRIAIVGAKIIGH
ncbi:hypothetical protein D3C75_1015370 [compost metagenome]